MRCNELIITLTYAEFQSTHPVWDGTIYRDEDNYCFRDFNPPIPCGMGRAQALQGHGEIFISIHPSRVGWDAFEISSILSSGTFQSTHPVWDGTSRPMIFPVLSCNFNPPIPCGMGRRYPFWCIGPLYISIHPSRVGWDLWTTGKKPYIMKISIHPSRVGWDCDKFLRNIIAVRFQSTHPVWDGTLPRPLHGL